MILLWGVMEDGPMAAVAARLEVSRAPWLFVDQRRTLESRMVVELDTQIRGELITPEGTLDLAEVSALYWRQYDFEQVLDLEPADRGSDAWRRAAAFESAMSLFAEHAHATVVNRPAATGSNNSKPYQLELIRNAGFAVPQTLLSSEPEDVIAFWRKHGAIIYKSISSCRSIVARFDDQDLASLDAVTCCPTQFQQYIAGTDYRVHVVGERVVSHRIVCGSDDYRYSGDTRIESTLLPDDVAARCVSLTRGLGLGFAGVDLRRSDDGEWFCFEVNPAPGFTYFDSEGCVCDALVDCLSGGPR